MEAFEFMKAVKKMRNDDIVIACMSPSSGGKDILIDLLLNQQQVEGVQRDDADEIQVTRIKHPNPAYDDRIVLLNTPGFDATASGADIRITSMIKDWLKDSYSHDVSLTGLIYVHNITETNAFHSLDQSLPLFGELCGWGKLSHVTLVSTMWDAVAPEVGIASEQELQSLFWRPIVDNRLSICRLEKDSQEEAWKIVNSLISDRDERESTLLQQKLIGFEVQLNKTETGREIYASFQQLVHDHEEQVQSLQAQIDASDNPVEVKKLRREYTEIKESFQTVLKGVKGMGIRPGKMIMNPFFEWRVRAKASKINNYLDLTSPASLANYPCASEFDRSPLQSFSEAGQSEDPDQTFRISAASADICENISIQRFITNLTENDAQCMIDLLNYIIGLEDVKASNRRQILFLMWKLAKSANVFPKYHDGNDVLGRSTQPLGDNSNLNDEWRASPTAKVDFQRALNLLDTGKGQERLYGELNSPKWSRQATLSPTLSHSTDSQKALSSFSAESSPDVLSSVSTARAIEDFSLVSYPEGIQGPDSRLNADVQNGKFRYDRNFLLQFMKVCTARPVALPALDAFGLEAINPLFGGSRLHRQKIAITNKKHTPYNSHRSPSKSPELLTTNSLRGPLPPNERLADLNYYLPMESNHGPARSGSGYWDSPAEDTEPRISELAASATDNSDIPFMLQNVPDLRSRERALRGTVAAPSRLAQITSRAVALKGQTAREAEYSQHQLSMPCGSPKHVNIGREPPLVNSASWAVAVDGNLKPAKLSSKTGPYNFGNFGKIDRSPPAMFGPGSVFAGKRNKGEHPFRAN